MTVKTETELRQARRDQLRVDLREIRKDLERQAGEKGFDHKKTSLWKLTGSLLGYIGYAEE